MYISEIRFLQQYMATTPFVIYHIFSLKARLAVSAISTIDHSCAQGVFAISKKEPRSGDGHSFFLIFSKQFSLYCSALEVKIYNQYIVLIT